MTATVDRRPSRFGLLLSVSAALTAVGVLVFVSPPAALLVLAGALALGLGVELDLGALRSLALVVMLGGVVLGGLAAGEVVPLLVVAVAVAVAHDAADNAVDVGAQLGRTARTRRAESVHAAGTILVGAGGALAGYAVYATVTGGKPVATVALLVVGALLVLVTLKS